MKRVCIAMVLAAIPLRAQFHVSFSDQSLRSSLPIFGKSNGTGLWTVIVCNDYPTKQSIDVGRILQAFPDIPVLPLNETADQLSRQAAQDKRSIIGNAGDAVLGIVGSGTSIGGFAIGNPTAQYVGFGILGAQLVLRLFKGAHPAPNATPYLADELPETETLAAGSCDRQRWVLAGLVHGAHAEQATIWLPGTQPTPVAPQKTADAIPPTHPETPSIVMDCRSLLCADNPQTILIPVKPGDPPATTTPSPAMIQQVPSKTQMTCDYDPATGRVYDCSPQSELIRSQTVVAAWSVSPKPPSFEVLATTPAHF